MTDKKTLLSLMIEGKRIEVDPMSGVFRAVINGKRQEFDTWKKTKSAVLKADPGAARGSKAKKKTIARPGWWISSNRARAGFLLATGRFGLERRVELIDGGSIAPENMEFEDIAWLDRIPNPQLRISGRIQALKDRMSFIQEHEYRVSKAMTGQQALDFLAQAESIEQDAPEVGLGWEPTSGGRVRHRGGWTLTAVAHGRTGSFLAYHLVHTNSGEMVVFTNSVQAMEFVAKMEVLGAGQGRKCIIFKNGDLPLTQLMSGKLVCFKGVASRRRQGLDVDGHRRGTED